MPKKLTPSDSKFWSILLWYHIFDLVGYFMQDEADHFDSPKQISPAMITYMLDQIFPSICPGVKRWMTGTELLSVWIYEWEHPEIGEQTERFIKEKGILRGWG